MKNLTVLVLGQGYVGLPVAMAAASAGHTVIGFDVDEARVSRLGKGVSPISDISDQQVVAALESGRYRPTSSTENIGRPDVFVITVPTPLRDARPDVSAVEQAAEIIADHISARALVVLESTSYPGTTEEVVGRVIFARSRFRPGQDFFLAFSPERIDPGNTKWTLRNTPKLLAGVDQASQRNATDFYSTFVDTVVPVAGVREAEFAKLLENTFRQVNIALVNELLVLARRVGIDFWEVLRAASTKPFGFMSFTPGPGVGGHCLPIDPRYLSWKLEHETGQPSDFISLATEVNERMPIYVVDRVARLLGLRGVTMTGSRILAFGVSYKGNSQDGRESPALSVIQEATRRGATVTAFDPIAEDIPTTIKLVRSEHEINASEFDIGVLLTNHTRHPVGQLASKLPVVLDTRNCLTGSNVVTL